MSTDLPPSPASRLLQGIAVALNARHPPVSVGGLGGPLALDCWFKQGEIGMVFSSNVFLFLFLPIFLGLYYLSGQRYRNLLLLIASYIFYAWWRVDFLALFAG